MNRFIITCNAGSSNIKLAKYDAKTLDIIVKHKVSNISDVIAWYKEQSNVIVVCHRIVHGGTKFFSPIIIDEDVLAQLKTLECLAPIHQKLAISIISEIRKHDHNVKHTASFDTAFHKDLPELEKLLTLPYSYYKEGIHRYGFHGLSYEYVASTLQSIIGERINSRIIVAHLGNGASICGMINLKSKAISMGFSPIDGLMMGSRSGSIDPGVLIHLLKEKNMSINQVEDLLYNQSGLKGASNNISNDVKILEADNSTDSKRALDLYSYIAAKHIGSIATAIRGIDFLVFTGGIGENSSYIRNKICSYLNWLGVSLDETLNQKSSSLNIKKISVKESIIQVYILHTDEEKTMVRHCSDIIGRI